MKGHLFLLGSVFSLALAVLLAIGLHQHERDRPPDLAPVYLPPAWLASGVSLSHRHLAADYFWLQALQYYGTRNNRLVYWRDLHRYIDLAIALDPDFEYAYYFGGTVIPFHRGGWRWENVPEAVAVLEKGQERFPDSWRISMQLGFVRGIVGDDLEGAAAAYRQAAAAPGSPPWIPKLVARLYAASGKLEAARAYTLEVIRHTEQPELREAMVLRLAELTAEEHLQLIDDAVRHYTESFGKPPERIEQLVEKGLIGEIPEEPLGGRYELKEGQPISTSLHKGRLTAFEGPRQ